MSDSRDCRSMRSAKAIIANVLLWIIGIAVVLGAVGYVAFQVSPWPAALLIRIPFDKQAISLNRALEKHVPQGVTARLNEHYDATAGDAYLDIYSSEIKSTAKALPTIVWVHGGAWISGRKDYIDSYLKILAGRGYTVVGVGYSLAPGDIYPTPIRQLNAALAYLAKKAQRLHVDPSRFVLAGDSAGAHIVAQVANVVAVPSYAKAMDIVPSIGRSQLRGVILYCGAYDMKQARLDGPFGGFLKTVLWSYSGEKNFTNAPRFATASVINYVTADFPPAFISAGNADPLLPQSRAFADVLARRGVHVERLFFPDDYKPVLPHEYQFDLDTDAGQLALERSIEFLSAQ
jgi:acetyl esterase